MLAPCSPQGVRAGPWARWSTVREPLERKSWLGTGLFGALHRSKEGPVTQHRWLRLGFATSPQVAAQTPAFRHSSGPAQGQVPLWQELLQGYGTVGPCSSLFRGLRQDWEPQPEDNNPGKKPSFYNLVMGSASFRALFSFLHPHSHRSQDLKASTRMWSLPQQDWGSWTTRSQKDVFLSPPTAPIQ